MVIQMAVILERVRMGVKMVIQLAIIPKHARIAVMMAIQMAITQERIRMAVEPFGVSKCYVGRLRRATTNASRVFPYYNWLQPYYNHTTTPYYNPILQPHFPAIL